MTKLLEDAYHDARYAPRTRCYFLEELVHAVELDPCWRRETAPGGLDDNRTQDDTRRETLAPKYPVPEREWRLRVQRAHARSDVKCASKGRKHRLSVLALEWIFRMLCQRLGKEAAVQVKQY